MSCRLRASCRRFPASGQGPDPIARQPRSRTGSGRSGLRWRAVRPPADVRLPRRSRGRLRRRPRRARSRQHLEALAVPALRLPVATRARGQLAARRRARRLRRQLCWRDFYAQLLLHHPTNARDEFREKYRGAIDWNDSDDDFAAWCEGRTGYPLVDAGMRQLRREGWMHDRRRLPGADRRSPRRARARARPLSRLAREGAGSRPDAPSGHGDDSARQPADHLATL
jgi:hypothetical protein